MEIVVHERIVEVLQRPLAKRPQALREVLAPLYQHVPLPGDPVDLHHEGGGFRVDREVDGALEAAQRMLEEDVAGQIERELRRAWRHLTDAVPAIKGPQRLEVMLMMGNPEHDYLMRVTGGYYGMGGAPGWLYLLAWPNDEVIGRIAHCAVHEFHHQVRYHNVGWNPATVTVGEHVIAEGLAEAFVRELSGAEAMGPWSSRVTGADLKKAQERILADMDLAGMRHTPAYVLGDTAAVKFGGQALGIADMAGYAVGLWLVDKHLAATGMSVAASTVLPGVEILGRTSV